MVLLSHIIKKKARAIIARGHFSHVYKKLKLCRKIKNFIYGIKKIYFIQGVVCKKSEKKCEFLMVNNPCYSVDRHKIKMKIFCPTLPIPERRGNRKI